MESASKPLRICYFGTYRAEYTRSQILLKGLKAQADVTVYECHSALWQGIDDRVQQASGGWAKPGFLWRVIKAYWKLFRAHNKTPEYDVMLIGYPGQFDAYLGRWLSAARRKPMALDILMSLYLVAEERGLTEKSPGTAKLLFNLEKVGLYQPHLLIAENAEYEAYIRGLYQLPPERFRHLPHGADNATYHPRPVEPPSDVFRVTYHGTWLPSHGMDVVLGAVLQLRDEPGLEFHFYGSGPELAKFEQTVKEQRLQNVVMHGFVSQDELLDGIASSHLCLGVFGNTRQAMFTVQNKLWEGLAMARPVISGESPTVRESLQHDKEIYLVERNPEALAAGILELKQQPEHCENLARQGHQAYLAGHTPAAIGRRLAELLCELSKRSR